MLASGALGSPRPGSMYLLRLHKFLVWLQILECGANGTFVVDAKGLELQETSCHNVEAREALEDGFDMALETPAVELGAAVHLERNSKLNPRLWHTLEPLGVLPLRTWSVNDFSLIGVLDNNETLVLISKLFIRTLHWAFVRNFVGVTLHLPVHRGDVEGGVSEEKRKAVALQVKRTVVIRHPSWVPILPVSQG